MSLLSEFKVYLMEKGYRQNTVDTYTDHAKQLIRWHRINRDEDLKELLRTSFLDFRKFLREERENAPGSIKVKTHALKQFNQFLKEADLQSRQVILKQDNINLYTSNLSAHIPTEEEVECFLGEITRRESPRNIAIVYLLATSGLKISECLGLRREDFDPGQQCIHLRNETGHVARSVPIPRETVELVEAYLPYRDSNLPHLFVSRNNNPVCRTRINQVFNAYSNSITPKSLRHYYCIKCLEQGLSVEDLAKRVGNISLQQTRKYQKWLMEESGESQTA